METTIKIKGMNCGSCKALIEDTVIGLPGIQSCNVDLASSQAKITHSPEANLQQVKSAIEGLEEFTVELPPQ